MEKENKKVFSRLGIALFLITIIVTGVQYVMVTLIKKFAPGFAESSWYVYSTIIVAFYLIGAPIFWLLVRNVPKKEAQKKKSLKWYEFLYIFMICLASLYALNIVGTMINYALGMLTGNMNLNPLNSVIGEIDLLPTFLIAGIASPIVEELVFRKVLLERLTKYGDVIAILVSGLCFGLYHGNISQFLYASVLGFIFAYVVIRTGDIRYSMALHIFTNVCGTVLVPQLIKLGTIATVLVGMGIIGLIIVGLIMVIIVIATKKLKFEKGEIILEHPFKTVCLNVGMILYVLISLAACVSVVLNVAG